MSQGIRRAIARAGPARPDDIYQGVERVQLLGLRGGCGISHSRIETPARPRLSGIRDAARFGTHETNKRRRHRSRRALERSEKANTESRMISRPILWQATEGTILLRFLLRLGVGSLTGTHALGSVEGGLIMESDCAVYNGTFRLPNCSWATKGA